MHRFFAFLLVIGLGSFVIASPNVQDQSNYSTDQVQQTEVVTTVADPVIEHVAATSILCEVGICGHGRNHYKSVRNIAFKCANGEWWWVRPGNEEPCKDAVKAKVPTTGNTWRIYPKSPWAPERRVLQKRGTYITIQDGTTVRLRSYS